jgi:CRP-like cAMP-binding protein
MLLVERILALQATEILKDLPQTGLATLANFSRVVEIAAGETLFREGETGRSLYVVVDGEVGVYVGERQVAKLAAPSVLGEMAALDPEPRSATVRSIADTLLLEISDALLNRIIDDNPDVARAIIRLLCRRLRDANRRLAG